MVKEEDGTLSLHLQNGEVGASQVLHCTSPSPSPFLALVPSFNRQVHRGFDQILSATGRVPLTPSLRLQKAGITPLPSGHISVDAFQNTSTPGVLALGDVCGKVELTPMAIAAGRRLADRLFGGIPDAKADYDLVPTVVFSHPVIGTIGLTEKQAREKFNEEDLKVCSCCRAYGIDV